MAHAGDGNIEASHSRMPEENAGEPSRGRLIHLREISQTLPEHELRESSFELTALSMDEHHEGEDQEHSQTPAAPPSEKSLSLGRWLDMVLVMSHLAFFSVIGSLIRSGLESLFGPQMGHVTDHDSALFVDLPANMVGSFISGWTQIVLREHIAYFSEPLAVGLSTGLCGSITTFASWNQRMLAILANGLWVRSLAGYLIGAELAQMSLLVGMDTAKAFKTLVTRWRDRQLSNGKPACKMCLVQPDHVDRRWGQLLFFFSTSTLVFFGAAVGTAVDVNCMKRRRLWLGLATAPMGVWIRWYLAQFNGQGLGKQARFKWFPIGTFGTNVVASVVEAAISLANIVASTTLSALTVGGLQLGLLGCMSTVSTLAVETNALYRAPSHHWRAYVYPSMTLLVSYVLSILVYNVPIWAFNFKSRYNHMDHC